MTDTRNTKPDVTASVTSSRIHLSVSSFGGVNLLLQNLQQNGIECNPVAQQVELGLDSSSVDCTSTLDYVWDWHTAAACATTTTTDTTVSYDFRLVVVDTELSGYLFGEPSCVTVHNAFTLRFTFPSIVQFSGTLPLTVLSGIEEQHAIVNTLRFNTTSNVTTTQMQLALPYPYTITTTNSSTPVFSCANPTQCSGEVVDSEGCAADSEGPCITRLSLRLVGSTCDSLSNPVTFYFNVMCRFNDPALCPVISNPQSLQLEVPKFVSCTVGGESLLLSMNLTTWSLTDGQLEQTSIFPPSSQVTLQAAFVTTPPARTSATLSRIRACVVSSMLSPQVTDVCQGRSHLAVWRNSTSPTGFSANSTALTVFVDTSQPLNSSGVFDASWEQMRQGVALQVALDVDVQAINSSVSQNRVVFLRLEIEVAIAYEWVADVAQAKAIVDASTSQEQVVLGVGTTIIKFEDQSTTTQPDVWTNENSESPKVVIALYLSVGVFIVGGVVFVGHITKQRWRPRTQRTQSRTTVLPTRDTTEWAQTFSL